MAVTKLRPSQLIADDLREQIATGYYRPGQQLPSGTTLMEQYGVARQTVQNAIDQLRAEGLIVSRSGAGVFVRDTPEREAVPRTSASRAGGYVVERVTTRYATPQDAETIGRKIRAGDLVLAVRRTRYDETGATLDSEQTLFPADQCELVYEAPAS